MSTPERGPGGLGGELPAESRAVAAVTPSAGATPTGTAPTPGLSLASARVPTSPTLPDPEPVSLGGLLSRMANELFQAPPGAGAVPGANQAPASAPAPSGPSVGGAPSIGATPSAGGATTTPAAAPSAPPVAPSAPPAVTSAPAGGTSPARAPASPGYAPSLEPSTSTAPTPNAVGAPSGTAAPSSGASSNGASGTPPAPREVAAPRGLASPAGAAASPFHAPLSFDAIAARFEAPSFGPIGSLPIVDHAPGRPPVEASPYWLTAAPASPSIESPRGFETESPRVGVAGVDPHVVRREFPILEERVNGKRLVWLDNAATTQKPRAVIDRLSSFYEHENSNIHRAAHTLAARATEAYEGARESVRRFIGAGSARDIVFVRGTTEGINLIANTWGRQHIGPGDEIVITWLEHHANIVPWQMLCQETGARLQVAPVDDDGQIILEEYERLLGPRTRLVSMTQVSNALGTITPARAMIELAHQRGIKVVLDGAQSVSHMRVDVRALDCDFFVFSGHKVFGPTGIGVVYAKPEILESMRPWQGGGNMIEDVTFERTVYQKAPMRFEAGTGNIADAVGLGAALDWLTKVGIDAVDRYEHTLLEYGTAQLATVRGLRMIGTAPHKAGVLSFTLAGQKTTDVGGLLDRDGIAVRSGHHCAQPILRRFGVEATVRASLAPYNTHEDLDALVEALHRLQHRR